MTKLIWVPLLFLAFLSGFVSGGFTNAMMTSDSYPKPLTIQTFITTTITQPSALILYRPSMQTLQQFLDRDQTNKKEYQHGTSSTLGYICLNYADELRLNARHEGINMSIVDINFIVSSTPFGHSFNAVILSDGSFVWIDSMADKIYIRDPDWPLTKVAAKMIEVNYPLLAGKPATITEMRIVW